MADPAAAAAPAEAPARPPPDDEFMRSFAVGRLFQSPPDAIDLIREKEILDSLEKAIDACDDVCDLIRSVVVKHG